MDLVVSVEVAKAMASRFIDGEFEALALSNNKKIELGATISHFLLNSSQFALFINNN